MNHIINNVNVNNNNFTFFKKIHLQIFRIGIGKLEITKLAQFVVFFPLKTWFVNDPCLNLENLVNTGTPQFMNIIQKRH